MAKHISDQEKAEFVQQVDELRKQGMTITKACEKLGRHYTVYYDYRKYLPNGAPAREVKVTKSDSDLKLLKIENQRLRRIVSDLMLDRQQLMEYCGRV